jgi:hypothetical protein
VLLLLQLGGAGDERGGGCARDVTLLKQAMLHDPLIGWCATPKKQMTDGCW